MDRTKDHYPSLDIGVYTYGIPNILGLGQASLYIGKFCSISEQVTIILGQEHKTDWITTYPFSVEPQWGIQRVNQVRTKGDVWIGSDVWIGYGTTILSGVTIGHGACIGAESVVTGDVPPYCVVAGNPSRPIRTRFSDCNIKELLEIAWWDMPIDKIKSLLLYMLSDDVDAFIRKCKELQ